MTVSWINTPDGWKQHITPDTMTPEEKAEYAADKRKSQREDNYAAHMEEMRDG